MKIFRWVLFAPVGLVLAALAQFILVSVSTTINGFYSLLAVMFLSFLSFLSFLAAAGGAKIAPDAKQGAIVLGIIVGTLTALQVLLNIASVSPWETFANVVFLGGYIVSCVIIAQGKI
jgi:hypothetical protein